MPSSLGFQFYLNTVIIGPLCILGLLGNTISFFILFKEPQNRVAIFLLQVLAIADNAVLIISFITMSICQGILMTVDLDSYMLIRPYLIKYVNPAGGTAQCFVIYTTVLLAVNRYAAICKPFAAGRFLNMASVKIQVILVFLVSLSLNLPLFLRCDIGFLSETPPSNISETLPSNISETLPSNISETLTANVSSFPTRSNDTAAEMKLLARTADSGQKGMITRRGDLGQKDLITGTGLGQKNKIGESEQNSFVLRTNKLSNSTLGGYRAKRVIARSCGGRNGCDDDGDNNHDNDNNNNYYNDDDKNNDNKNRNNNNKYYNNNNNNYNKYNDDKNNDNNYYYNDENDNHYNNNNNNNYYNDDNNENDNNNNNNTDKNNNYYNYENNSNAFPVRAHNASTVQRLTSSDNNIRVYKTCVKNRLGNDDKFNVYFFNGFYNVVVFGLPLVLLILFNISIAWQLQAAKNRMRANSISYEGRQEDNISFVMIFIIVQLIVFHLPDRFCLIAKHVLPPESIMPPHALHYALFISNLLIIFNCTNDFIIYFAFRKRFRAILRASLCHSRSALDQLEENHWAARPLRSNPEKANGISPRPSSDFKRSPLKFIKPSQVTTVV